MSILERPEPRHELLDGLLVSDPRSVPYDEGDAMQLMRVMDAVAIGVMDAVAIGAPSSTATSGLTGDNLAEARRFAVAAARVALLHAPSVHYTMGPKRWSGITGRHQAAIGGYPRQCDCSSFYTWCLWNPLRLVRHLPDVVNDLEWLAGYTGTQLRHGVEVRHRRNWHSGDALIYGSGWPGKHVAMYVGGGLVISHGSEGGPYLIPYDYRDDLMQVRRFI